MQDSNLKINNWVALKTLTRKEVIRFLRIWGQTLLPAPITMFLYCSIFGSLIGPKLGMIHGVPYIAYIMPGLIMMGIINNSYTNVVFSFFINKFHKSLEEILVSSMSNNTIVLGYMLGGIVRGLIVGIMATILALCFTQLPLYSVTITFSIVLITAALFSLTGLINGVVARSFDDINIVPIFVLTPLTYFGGMFYSIDMLSPFMQKLSHLNPIFYIINIFRYGILGISDINVYLALCTIIACTIVLYLLCLWLLNKGIGIRT